MLSPKFIVIRESQCLPSFLGSWLLFFAPLLPHFSCIWPLPPVWSYTHLSTKKEKTFYNFFHNGRKVSVRKAQQHNLLEPFPCGLSMGFIWNNLEEASPASFYEALSSVYWAKLSTTKAANESGTAWSFHREQMVAAETEVIPYLKPIRNLYTLGHSA